jgi:hypothetical protein
MSIWETAWIFWLLLAALCLGLLLARFNVFALMVASVLFAVSLMLYLVQDSTLVHSILLSLGITLAVQVGYLIGQFMRKPSG